MRNRVCTCPRGDPANAVARRALSSPYHMLRVRGRLIKVNDKELVVEGYFRLPVVGHTR